VERRSPSGIVAIPAAGAGHGADYLHSRNGIDIREEWISHRTASSRHLQVK